MVWVDFVQYKTLRFVIVPPCANIVARMGHRRGDAYPGV